MFGLSKILKKALSGCLQQDQARALLLLSQSLWWECQAHLQWPSTEVSSWLSEGWFYFLLQIYYICVFLSLFCFSQGQSNCNTLSLFLFQCGVCSKDLGDLLTPMFSHEQRITCDSCFSATLKPKWDKYTTRYDYNQCDWIMWQLYEMIVNSTAFSLLLCSVFSVSLWFMGSLMKLVLHFVAVMKYNGHKIHFD